MPAYVEIFDLINRILNNLVGTLAQRKSEKILWWKQHHHITNGVMNNV